MFFLINIYLVTFPPRKGRLEHTRNGFGLNCVNTKLAYKDNALKLGLLLLLFKQIELFVATYVILLLKMRAKDIALD